MSTIVVKEQYRLGDLDFARCFDHAIGVLRERFKPVVLVFAVVALPPILLYFVLDLVFGFSIALYADEFDSMAPEAFFALFFRGMAAVTGFSLFFQLIMLYLSGFVSYVVGMYYLDAAVSISSALRFTLGRIVPLVFAHILYVLVVAVGTLLCVIPGIYLGVLLYLFIPAVLFENAGPIQALTRSKDLILHGEFMRIFFLWLALGFVGAPLGILSFVVPYPAVDLLIQSLAGAVLQMFVAAVVTVIYFSLRCKHESLDLEILASQLDLEAAEEAPAL